MTATLLFSFLRENAGTSVAGNNVAAADGDDEDAPQQKGKASFSAFAALGIEEAAPEEEEEDFGGLMVCPLYIPVVLLRRLTAMQSVIKASKGKKDKKKAKKGGAEPTPDEPEDDAEVAASKKPVEVTAEDLADEEWGPVKGKKAKKGKAKKGKKDEEDEEDAPRDGLSSFRVRAWCSADLVYSLPCTGNTDRKDRIASC